MNIFYAVIVIYNCEISESKTCRRIEQILNHTIKVIIVDNSTVPNNNASLCAERMWEYISMNCNAGLSKAYNKALNALDKKSGIVIWFDDDTNVTQEYFDVLENAVIKYRDCDIFVPIIKGQDGQFCSPNIHGIFKDKQLKNVHQYIPNEKFNAINSCTAVRLEIYKNYRYDENLFLDQVDHKFFEDQRARKRKFCKMETIILHDLSVKSVMEDVSALKNRYRIMIPDFLCFYSKNKLKYILGIVKVIGWGIKGSVRYKAPGFFGWCIWEIGKYQRMKSDI